MSKNFSLVALFFLASCAGGPATQNLSTAPLAKVDQEKATKLLARVQTITQEIAAKAQSTVQATVEGDKTADVDCKDGGKASASWHVNTSSTETVDTAFTIGFEGCKYGIDLVNGRLEYQVSVQSSTGAFALATSMKGDLSVESRDGDKAELVNLTQDVSLELDTAKKTCVLSGEVKANGDTFKFDKGNCSL